MRKLAAWAVLVLLLIGVSLGAAEPARGAGLSGGSYTYLLNGEEIAFPFDPLVIQDELLLPAAVFERLGVTISQSAGGRSLTLRLGDQVTAKLTLGNPGYHLLGAGFPADGLPQSTAVGPIRLGGHLFVPASLLVHFGVEVTRESGMVMLRNPVPGLLPSSTFTDLEFQLLKGEQNFRYTIAPKGTSALLSTEFTLLHANLLEAAQLGLPYGQRARLYGMLETHTLVLVRVLNQGTGPGAFNPASVSLVDDLRRQADQASALDIGEGNLDAALSPGAERRGVLAFPKGPTGVTRLSLYYHEIPGTLGSFQFNP